MKKKILMVVGGTGGHIYPALALASELAGSIDFVIDKRPLAEKVLSEKGCSTHRITAAALPRKKFWHICKFILKMLIGTVESLILLGEIKPDVIVAFGSYISVPVVLASKFFKIPVVLHEQNYFPGLANKFLTLFARKVAVSYRASLQHFPAHKAVLTGNPVRKELFEVNREESLKFFGLERDKITILIIGGSLGSESINISVAGILPYLEEFNDRIQFIHICGDKNFQKIVEKYIECDFTARVYKYLKKIEYAYGSADLIIARAGATTLAEITALGIPSILIPYPDATSGHQLLNAKPLCKIGGAIYYDEDKLSGEGLALRLVPLVKDINMRREMSIKTKVMRERFTGAAKKLADVVMEVTKLKKEKE